MRLLLCFCAIALPQLLGCASIVSGQNQSISVETRTETGFLAGAQCKLSNDKGTWYVTSPGSTVVQRSYQDLGVRCEKEPHDPGIASVKSSTKAMAFGNILIGGVIGAGIDVGTGAAFDYPSLITVFMGKATTIDGPPETAASASVPGQPRPTATVPAAAVASAETPSGPAEAATPSTPGSGASGLRVLLRDTDPLTKVTSSESVLTIDSVSERGTTLNGGFTTLDPTGRLLTGSVPLPHIAGLGGGRLGSGSVMTASLVPASSSPPVEVRIGVLRMETLRLSEREIAVFKCTVSGYATYTPYSGQNPAERGATISGEIAVEPATGLVLSADVKSRHPHYAFVRSALPAAR